MDGLNSQYLIFRNNYGGFKHDLGWFEARHRCWSSGQEMKPCPPMTCVIVTSLRTGDVECCALRLSVYYTNILHSLIYFNAIGLRPYGKKNLIYVIILFNLIIRKIIIIIIKERGRERKGGKKEQEIR